MKQLTIAGLGIREFDQLTLESLKAIQEAEITLHLSTTPERVSSRLKEFNIQNVEDLRPYYLDGAHDLDNYKAILKHIFSACQKHSKVCVLLPGHPRVGVTIVYWLEKLKDSLKIQLNVLEGISSFCAMINELAIDPLEHGAAVLDANRVLQRDQPLDPSIDCFIYHVCSVGVSATNISEAQKDNRIDLLQEKLKKHYPENHPVILISAGRGSGEETSLSSATVGTLDFLLSKIHFGTTLYIPSGHRHE